MSTTFPWPLQLRPLGNHRLIRARLQPRQSVRPLLLFSHPGFSDSVFPKTSFNVRNATPCPGLKRVVLAGYSGQAG